MKYALIELPEDFEKGHCLECPLGYVTDDADVCCSLNSRYYECPLEIKEKKGEKN